MWMCLFGAPCAQEAEFARQHAPALRAELLAILAAGGITPDPTGLRARCRAACARSARARILRRIWSKRPVRPRQAPWPVAGSRGSSAATERARKRRRRDPADGAPCQAPAAAAREPARRARSAGASGSGATASRCGAGSKPKRGRGRGEPGVGAPRASSAPATEGGRSGSSAARRGHRGAEVARSSSPPQRARQRQPAAHARASAPARRPRDGTAEPEAEAGRRRGEGAGARGRSVVCAPRRRGDRAAGSSRPAGARDSAAPQRGRPGGAAPAAAGQAPAPPQRREEGAEASCSNCGTTKSGRLNASGTPKWYLADGKRLCNACGQYLRRTGCKREV